jgi:hypothetical protein
MSLALLFHHLLFNMFWMFQEHIQYIRYNNPQSVYALHILQNQHKSSQINSTMTLLKPIIDPNLLLPYEQ